MPSDNKYMARYVSDRSLLLKLEAIEYKGGKCQKCGYDKCYAAFDFHHRDPNEKEFGWNKLKKRSKETIFKELDKCDLLCANCHREIHVDPNLMAIVVQRSKDRIKTKNPTFGNCAECGTRYKKKMAKQKYCCHKCSEVKRTITDWPDNLPALIKASSNVAVAKQLGVSESAVRKRLKNHHA